MELKYFNVKYGKHEVNIPYYEIIGKKPGPMGFVSAGIHGNEINGINIVKNFVRISKMTDLETKLRGILLVFPVLNVSGFKKLKKKVVEDGYDLNLLFGEKTTSSFSSAIAYELSHNFFKKCDFGIDFHDSSSSLVYLPNVRIYKNRESQLSTNLDLSMKFGTKIIRERHIKKNIMSNALENNFGTTVVTVEVGRSGYISNEVVKPMINGIKNILGTYKMIDHKLSIPKSQFILTENYGFRAKESGIVNLNVELGQKVVKNERLGSTFYPQLQKEEIIFAERTGIIVGRRFIHHVKKGQIVLRVYG